MKKQQIYLSIAGLLLLSGLLIFGKTVAKKEPIAAVVEGKDNHNHSFNIDEYLLKSKTQLTTAQSNYISRLENSVSRGDVKEQQIKVFNQLASFWKDSMKNSSVFVFYSSQAAKLVSSEKNLSFAAQLILSEVRKEEDLAKRGWKAEQAIALFEKAIELNPANDSLKVGLGSCYVFGKGMAGSAEETMKGIQTLLQVVRKDSLNMQAQLVLGIGGVVSTQYDKAIQRLLTVLQKQPNNLEAISWLADAYAAKGNKAEAMRWYETSKRMVNNPQFSKEVDERIKQIK